MTFWAKWPPFFIMWNYHACFHSITSKTNYKEVIVTICWTMHSMNDFEVLRRPNGNRTFYLSYWDFYRLNILKVLEDPDCGSQNQCWVVQVNCYSVKLQISMHFNLFSFDTKYFSTLSYFFHLWNTTLFQYQILIGTSGKQKVHSKQTDPLELDRYLHCT
jgi:hypothetical protein